MKRIALFVGLSLLLVSCASKRASYDYTQSQVEHGDLNFADRLRVDEYINAFRQDGLPSPARGRALSLSIAYFQDRMSDSANKTLVQIAIKSRVPLPSEKESNAGICVVLDVSGSMADDHKLEDARIALKRFVLELNNGTQFSLVIFDDRPTLVIPPVFISGSHRQEINQAIDELHPGGGTDIFAGLVEGYRQLSKMSHVDLSRLILITDGMSTVGNATPESLAKEAGTHYANGVRISTIGLGHDVDEQVLRRIAEEGNGQYYFADRADKLSQFLTSDFKTMLYPVAKEVNLSLLPAPGFRIAAVYGFRKGPAGFGEPVNVQFGELNVDDWRIVIAELEGNHAPGRVNPLSAEVTYQDIRKRKSETLKVDHSISFDSTLTASQAINRDVARNSVIFADAMALIKASQLARLGKYSEASDVLSIQLTNVRVVEQWDKTDSMKAEEDTLQRVRAIIRQQGGGDVQSAAGINGVGNEDSSSGTAKMVRATLEIAEKTVPGPWSLIISLFSLF